MAVMEYAAPLPQTPGRVLASFVALSLSFSLNHGCVVASLSLASDQLGPQLGGVSSGVLYAVYTATALLVAPDIIRRFNAKPCLNLAAGLYCLYVGSYAVALAFPQFRWAAVITGAALGGFSAGILWPAQGTVYAQAAEAYCRAHGGAGPDAPTPAEASSFFGGVFATFYLGCELAVKLTSTAILRGDAPDAGVRLFELYFALAVLSAVALLAIPPFDRERAPPRDGSEGDPGPGGRSGSPKVCLALTLVSRDPKVVALAPINVAFGLMAALLNFRVNLLAGEALGSEYIGILSSVISASATLASPLLSLASNRAGRAPVLVLGGLAFLVEVAILGGISGTETLGRWILVYVLHGTGRAVWENPVRALTADFFPSDREGAFALAVAENGAATAVGYFTFPSLELDPTRVVCAISLVLWIVGYAVAQRAHDLDARRLHQLRERLMEQEPGDDVRAAVAAAPSDSEAARAGAPAHTVNDG